jgi:hypothetical protein
MDFDRMARDRNVVEKPDPKNLKEWKGWTELGWNEDFSKYQQSIQKPKIDPAKGEFLHEGMFNAVVKASHDFRAPPAMVQEIYGAVTQAMNADLAAITARGAQELTAAETALRTEWGGDYDTKKALGARAMQHFGLAAKDARLLDQALGAPGLVKMFSQIGEMIGEDKLVTTGNSAAPGGAAAARRERLALEADEAFMKVLNDPRSPQHQEFMARRQRLIAREAEAGGA